MKIILLQDEKKLGKKGDIIEASEGYARNYILPKKIGVEATSKNMNDLKLQKANEEKVAQENLDAAKALAAELETKQVMVKIKAGRTTSADDPVSVLPLGSAGTEPAPVRITLWLPPLRNGKYRRSPAVWSRCFCRRCPTSTANSQ